MSLLTILLSVLSVGCTMRAGAGGMAPGVAPIHGAYVPSTRVLERDCNVHILGGIPVGEQATPEVLERRLMNKADGLVDVVFETENFMAFFVSVTCLSMTATKIQTGASHAE